MESVPETLGVLAAIAALLTAAIGVVLWGLRESAGGLEESPPPGAGTTNGAERPIWERIARIAISMPFGASGACTLYALAALVLKQPYRLNGAMFVVLAIGCASCVASCFTWPGTARQARLTRTASRPPAPHA